MTDATGPSLSRRGAMLGALLPWRYSTSARAEVPAWHLVTEYPANTMPGEGVAAFAELVTREAAGQLTIQPGYDAPDGLRSAQLLDAVASGRFEAADAFTGALGTSDPLFQLSSLPFLTASTHDADRLWSLAEPAYRAVLASRGLMLLYATPWPPTGLWSRHPVTDRAALAGLRIRTYDAASTAVFSMAGATPTRLSFADTSPRVAAGALDAVLSSGDGGAGARLWEHLPCFTVLDYAFPLSLAFCSAAALGGLAPPARDALAKAGPEITRRQFTAVDARVAANEARLAAQGVQVSRNGAVRDALAAVSGPVLLEWEQNVGTQGTQILKAYRS